MLLFGLMKYAPPIMLCQYFVLLFIWLDEETFPTNNDFKKICFSYKVIDFRVLTLPQK